MANSAVSLAISAAAGFILIQRTYLTKFEVQRADSQQLVFLTTVAALFLFMVSRGTLSWLSHEWPGYYSGVLTGWLAIVPHNALPWIGTATGSVLIATSVPSVINLWWPRDKANRRAIKNYGSQLEQLMLGAFDHQMPIAVTLKSRKVYVGRVMSLPPILEIPKLTDMRLLPYISGYRDEKTFAYTFTTNYTEVYQRIVAAASQGDKWQGAPIFTTLSLQNFEVVIPLAEITTAHMFERKLHSEHGELFAVTERPRPTTVATDKDRWRSFLTKLGHPRPSA